MTASGLLDQIRAAVVGRGLALEREVVMRTARAGLLPELGPLYSDLEGEPATGPIWREGDVFGSYHPPGLDPNATLISAVVECKHTTSCWIFPTDAVAIPTGPPFISTGDHLRLRSWPLLFRKDHTVPQVYFDHPYFSYPARARQYFVLGTRSPKKAETDKEREDSERKIRQAIKQAQKAAWYVFVRHAGKTQRRFVFPFVVTTARLFEARFTGVDLVVREVDRVLVEVDYPMIPHRSIEMTINHHMLQQSLWFVEVLTAQAYQDSIEKILLWREKLDRVLRDAPVDA